jgi:hypothetical protein
VNIVRHRRGPFGWLRGRVWRHDDVPVVPLSGVRVLPSATARSEVPAWDVALVEHRRKGYGPQAGDTVVVCEN